ncbi:CobW/HypB/UreG, nucleotide-binding domain [Ruminococcus sp. YE71]|uniref:TIGR03943 family putative permease subunit n=1 Tax=unclassified Ruminococcus TaxID=2608920 RepID=UPI00087E4510|nr:MULTISPECIES: GTP-binding protein [unclassified Ruminococcus]SDA27704.1 CobW/HypB/UreG, nucleotide-binding domain [Ruminococcus sp. YE78]SFW45953.1 CobW/HypB/UreG, nucleotide-binding domain [Ruminococcus sp. YE71]
MEENNVAVYLFTGFLESGKTQFIQKTVCGNESFNNGQRTVLIVCEEGIEEYDEEELAKANTVVRVIEDKEDLTPETLERFYTETNAERVIIEYNGMWLINDLFEALPEDWMIYQILNFTDATTFLSYNQNMRSLVVDKLNMCELNVFNRVDKATMDKMEFHKIVRGVSRRTQIAYEYTDGTGEYDDIEDPLPFDVTADHIVVDDRDFALWYRDIGEEPKKYDGKTISFKAAAMGNPKFPKGVIALGRQIMTCCVEDIQFCWYVTLHDQPLPDKPQWFNATVKAAYKWHKMYRGKGPVLTVVSLDPCDPPEQQVATFY